MMSDQLSRAMSAARKAQRRFLDALEYDHAIDCGEWSAAVADRALDIELEAIALRHGFDDAEEMFEAARVRTSDRWVHFFAGGAA